MCRLKLTTVKLRGLDSRQLPWTDRGTRLSPFEDSVSEHRQHEQRSVRVAWSAWQPPCFNLPLAATTLEPTRANLNTLETGHVT